jgi:ATP-dependent Clp protease adapter protein ClpS
MNPKDSKQLLTAVLNNDTATVKKIVDAYFESYFSTELENASKAIMESIGKEGKALYGN